MKTLFLLIWMTWKVDKSLACSNRSLLDGIGVMTSSSGSSYMDVACNVKIEPYATLDEAKAAATKKDIDDGIIYEIATNKRIRLIKKLATTYSYEFKEVK